MAEIPEAERIIKRLRAMADSPLVLGERNRRACRIAADHLAKVEELDSELTDG